MKVTINLVEKLIAIYRKYLPPHPVLPAAASAATSAAVSHTATTNVPSKSVELISAQAIQSICIIAGLWLLQDAFIASNLIAEEDFQLNAVELDALRSCFAQYDNKFSNEIMTDDLHFVLQVYMLYIWL